MVDTFRHRPELDGLRAVAVLAVLFFHADFGLPGGFVGVDVFFVLSGYLITSLIIRDLESGRFTFTEFRERRARRILPASTVLVAATLVAGSLLLMPSDFATLGSSATATAVFGASTGQYCADFATHRTHTSETAALASHLSQISAIVVDVSGLFVDLAEQRYVFDRGGMPFYVDEHHLSRHGALFIKGMLEPCLDSRQVNSGNKL
jgi:hypothetical protein